MNLLVVDAKNIADAFFKQAKATPDKTLFSQAVIGADDCAEDPRLWRSASFASAQASVCALADYLASIGVRKGTAVAILSASRPEWMIADIAVLSCGGISVSVYQSLPADDIAYILYDSEARFVIAENQEQVDKILSLLDTPQQMPGHEDRPAAEVTLGFDKIIAIEEVTPHELVVQWTEILEGSEAKNTLPEAIASIERDDVASLVYTSGTTGPPKGVVQTHGNHLANVRQAYESGMLEPRHSIAVFLPLAHAFARLMGYLGFLTPAELKFPAVVDTRSSKMIPQSISKDIREGSANINPLVPRLLEKMKDGVNQKAAGSGLSAKLLRLTLASAQQRFELLKDGKPVPLDIRLKFLLTSPLRKKIRKTLFGSDFEFCVSGGAKLPVPVAEYFAALGVRILEGYGLTETCVATNVGRHENNKIGTVGPVLSSDIEMQLSEDGEILFRGPNIALGYHRRPTATKESWDEEGWYHTGDLGNIDEDGYLTIIGRKKEIIVTSGGKNIAPHDIETKIKEHPLVSQAVLLGDGRKYCVAVITVNKDDAEAWLNKSGKRSAGEPLHMQHALHENVWAHISETNKSLASFETVKKIFIAPEDFSVENGFLTPTFKVKRAAIEKHYASEIDALYP